MISIILLSGAQVFLYPEGLNSIWVRPEMGESLTFLLSRRKAYWKRMAPDSHRSKTEHWTHSLPFLLPPAHPHQTPLWVQEIWRFQFDPVMFPAVKAWSKHRPGSFCLPACRKALPPAFPLIISPPLLRTMQIFVMIQCFWRGKWYWENHTMPLLGFFGIKTENPVFCTNLPITSF